MEKVSLKQLKLYKDEILRLIVNDEQLCRAIYNNSEECLLLPVESPGDLLYTKVFPYKHIVDDTQEEAGTFVTMDMAFSSVGSGYYYDFSIVLFVFTHKSLMRIKIGTEYQLRTDFILSRLETILSKTKNLGMGQLKLETSGSTYYGSNFPCFFVHYSAVDMSGKETNIGGD